MRSPFEQLGLSPEAGEREVRRAYARLLKGMDTVAQPEAFMGLRAAFEQALTQARRRAERAEPPDTESAQRPSGEWPSQGAQREATTPGLSHPAKAQDFDAPSAAFASAPASESESESAAGPESASPPASEWDREPPLVVARRLLESMPWRFAPEDLAAATQSLKTVLAQPALQGLQVREALLAGADAADDLRDGVQQAVLLQRQPGQRVVAAVQLGQVGGQGDGLHALDAADPAVQRRVAEVVAAQPAAAFTQPLALCIPARAQRGGGGVGQDVQGSDGRGGSDRHAGFQGINGARVYRRPPGYELTTAAGNGADLHVVLMKMNAMVALNARRFRDYAFQQRPISDTIISFPCRAKPAGMQAYVYKSQRKQDTYVYLAKRDDFDAIPASLGATLAPYTFVLEVALTPERRLAQVDAALVRANLAERGFHLQLPPQPLAPVKIARIDGRDD